MSPVPPKVVPAALWDEIMEFIEDQVDVKDGDDGRQEPNRAMSLRQQIAEEGLLWP
jgi:hypothetical protein